MFSDALANFKPGRLGFFILVFFVLAFFTFIHLLPEQRFGKIKKPTPKEQIAAKVKDETISLSQVEKFSLDCGINQKKALELLVDDKVLTFWAKDEKITISDDELETEVLRISGSTSTSQCANIQAKVNLLAEKLSDNTAKFREGKFIVVNFGLYNPSPYSLPHLADEAKRQENLKKDRAYADQLVDSIYTDLKANKLSFEEALAKVQNDPQVGLESPYGTSPQSGPFSASDYINKRGLIKDDVVKQKVDALAVGQFSEPFLQQVLTGDQEIFGSQVKFVDTRWIIAKVERASQGTNRSLEELLKATRDKYGTKIYI